MALRSTQPLIKMSTTNTSWGEAVSAMVINLTAFIYRLS